MDHYIRIVFRQTSITTLDSPKCAFTFVDIWVPNFGQRTPVESLSDGRQSQIALSFTDM